jgi:hypothetical protein
MNGRRKKYKEEEECAPSSMVSCQPPVCPTVMLLFSGTAITVQTPARTKCKNGARGQLTRLHLNHQSYFCNLSKTRKSVYIIILCTV